ncbi:hypothetical protein EB796_010655 [Bugula neritina]|uniref:Ig-like domain-containing protein n=1 Tax=Bugula neritina TaxID=10212 RepID=A0A7J7K099_BUGNE|nr:hypothetical protein EB796_010655 [Bugula neritina]
MWTCNADVDSGTFRTGNAIRLSTGAVTRRRFTLTRPKFGTRGSLRPRIPGGSRQGRIPLRRKPAGQPQVKVAVPATPTSTSATNDLGPVQALKAGEEGSYDFSDQFNAIIPDKTYTKPKKEDFVKKSNPNKINIESRIPLTTEEESLVTEVAHVGETAIVHCAFDDITQIGAYQQAKIWWTKLPERSSDRPVIMAAGTQVRIPDDRLRVVTFPDNTFSVLVIKNVLPSDAGKFKCSLPTITGTETRFTALEVKEAKSDGIAMSPKENALKSGEELSLFCQPQDPSLKVWWTAKDATGNNIDVTRGFDRVAGRNLIIRNIQGNQAGIYTCHVEIGFGSPIRRHFNVIVKERPWPIDAFISDFKVDSLLAQYNKDPTYGEDVDLRCETGGIPTPSVQWLKDGRLLSNSYKYIVTSYEPAYKDNAVISKLTVKNFQRYDAGRYQCKAVNDAGTQQQDFVIRGVATSVGGSMPSDDEDIGQSAALTSRRGEIKISICQPGRPCQIDSMPEYSGDGEI